MRLADVAGTGNCSDSEAEFCKGFFHGILILDSGIGIDSPPEATVADNLARGIRNFRFCEARFQCRGAILGGSNQRNDRRTRESFRRPILRALRFPGLRFWLARLFTRHGCAPHGLRTRKRREGNQTQARFRWMAVDRKATCRNRSRGQANSPLGEGFGFLRIWSWDFGF